MPTLNLNTPTTVGYSGAQVSYTMASTAALFIEIWGGGGGGGSANNNNTEVAGGAAGNVAGVLAVQAGDVVALEVGQGGRKGLTNGGAGGYPDGGNGGKGAAAAVCMGGGGGSTRVYLNSTLILVAAGGGGGLVNGRTAGMGGGLSGIAGSSPAGSGIPGGGGTQSAGGAAGTGAQAGASLQGGHGYPSGSNSTVAQNPGCGGGGGGGYYGGGGGGGTTSPSTLFGCGGGGSSYINSSAPGSFYTTAGTGKVAFDSGHKGSGVGQGGTNAQTTPTDGGDGSVYMVLQDASPPTSWTAINYTSAGAYQYYMIPATGVADVRMWGGGGGGGCYTTSASNGNGAGAGFISLKLALATNDVLAFMIGNGGGGAKTNGGGDGSYDGGYGGTTGGTSTGVRHGGGGGASTRLYINSVLFAVAGGGGGGAGANGAATPVIAGNGGGSSGGDGVWNGLTKCTGGSQSAGGANSSANGIEVGGSFSGGKGSTAAQATGNTYYGGGGGGGYFGGAGGGYYGGGSRFNEGSGGSGGSGYVKSDAKVTASTNSVNTPNGTATPAGTSDVNYSLVTPAGTGGNCSTSSGSTGANGSNGAALIRFASGLPGDAGGSLPTVTLTTPAGVGGGSGAASGSNSTLTVTNPAGFAGVAGTASGSFGTSIALSSFGAQAGIRLDITVSFPGPITNNGDELGGQGTADAFISIPVADNDITMFAPGGIGNVSTNVTKAFPGPINLSGLSARIPGFTTGDIGEIGVIAPEAFATPITSTSGDLATVLMVAPDATISAGVSPTGNIGALSMVAPDATAYTFVTGTGDLATIDLTSPTGSGTNGGTPFPDPIIMVPTEADVDIGPFTGELATLTLVAPEGGVDGYASGSLSTIDLTSPEGHFFDGSAHTSGSIGTITTTAPSGEFHYIGYSTPFENSIELILEDSSAGPWATAGGGGTGTGNFGTSISMTAFDATAAGEVSYDVQDFGTIFMTAPQAASVHSVTLLVSILPAQIFMRSFSAIAGPVNSVVVDADFGNLAIKLDSPEGYIYVDTPGWAKLLLKRSSTVGASPGTLAPREIAINEADGTLYTRDGNGTVQPTPLAAIQSGAFVPADATIGSLLRGDNSWGNVPPVYDKPVRIAPPAQQVWLSEGIVSATTLTPDLNRIYYRPFFVPKTITLTDIAVDVSVYAHSNVSFGICKWLLPQTPDLTIVSKTQALVTTGEILISGPIMLLPGWYAAMIAVDGPGSPTFNAFSAPMRLASDFSVSGDPTGPFTGNLDSLGSPNARASASIAFLKASITNE